jgi:hypothetical protein
MAVKETHHPIEKCPKPFPESLKLFGTAFNSMSKKNAKNVIFF